MTDILTLAPSVGVFAGDPNGSIAGAKGAILRDSTNGLLWINSTGSTAWVAMVRTDQVVGSSPFYFGDGEDGAAVFDGSTAVAGCTRSGTTYSATRELQITTATFTSGVSFRPSGYEYSIRTLVTPASGMAFIDTSGGDASGSTRGAAPWLTAGPLPNGLIGADGTGGGQNGGTATKSPRGFTAGAAAAGAGPPGVIGGTGGPGQGGGGGGGASGAGGAGGIVTLASATLGDWTTFDNAVRGRQPGDASGTAGAAFSCGSPGGSGGTGTGGPSGGGGASGGWQTGRIGAISGSLATITFRSKGGVGGVGPAGAFAAGGGGGGAGGIVVLVIGTSIAAVSLVIDVSGGLGGSGGTGAGTGAAGGAGGAGMSRIYQ